MQKRLRRESVLAVGSHSLVHTYEDDTSTTSVLDGTMHWLTKYINKKYVPCIQWNTLPTWPHYSTLNTIFARSAAVATIYSVHQFCAASIREQQLFKSGIYFTQPILSLTYSRRERSSIGWLLDRQENLLLVVTDWFTSLFWGCFTSSQLVFACAHATQVFVMPTVATIREQLLN